MPRSIELKKPPRTLYKAQLARRGHHCCIQTGSSLRFSQAIIRARLLLLLLGQPRSSPPVMAMEAEASFLLSPELRDALTKVAVFVLVQGMVYLILRSSSNVFSKDSKLRSMSFRPMRSMSVRRVLAPLSDVPVGTDEPSPSSSPSPSPSPSLSSTSTRRRASRED